MIRSSQLPFRFREYTWKQFKKNKPAYFSLYILGVLVIVALLAPILANERPLYMKYYGENFYPAFSFKNAYEVTGKNGTMERLQLDITDWKRFDMEKVTWALIPYSPGKSDYYNSNFVGPFDKQKFQSPGGKVLDMPARFRHWLGTGQRGEDLLSGLIHGTRISLTIGFISMGIASLIGIFLGAFAGFFGDDKLITTRGRFWITIIGVIFAWFYGFQLRSGALSAGLKNLSGGFLIQLVISFSIFFVVVYLFSLIGKQAGKLPLVNKRINIHADTIISRLIEILVSLPLFIIIIAIAAISKPSIINLMVIIGLTNWTALARLTRAEILRIRSLEFVQSAQALGFRQGRIIFRHALPNAIAPALVAVSFGIANAILIESALSFIGLGVPQQITTWGSLLNAGRGNIAAWWMVVFPGLLIFITVAAYNLIGEGLRDALDPKLKR